LSNNFSSNFDDELKFLVGKKKFEEKKKNTNFGSGDSCCNPHNPFSHREFYKVIVLT